MKNERIQTYGETVQAPDYVDELQYHPYIPQADAAIRGALNGIAERITNTEGRTARFLDVGMGPARLTFGVSRIPNTHVVGVDNSPAFVGFANKNRNAPNVEYVFSDFLNYNPREKFDAIFMQGVWHHVPAEKHQEWLEKMHSLLAPGGTIIVGDEFIPAYESEEEREHKVGLFYLHIIGEALKIQNAGLARNECLNFLADTLHTLDSRGYFDASLVRFIEGNAMYINERLLSLDESKRITGDAAAAFMVEVIEEVRTRSRALKDSGNAECIDRGDYKISPKLLESEMASLFLLVNRQDSGPVDHIGGMSVLTFTKKK